MTICVSVRVAEGLVMAADSAVTLHIKRPEEENEVIVLQTFNYASKLTQLSDFPMALLTWGLASIDNRTIQSLLMEWESNPTCIKKLVEDGCKVQEVAQSIIDFIEKKYRSSFENYTQGKVNGCPPLGISVGGYSKGDFFAKQYVWEFPISRQLSEARKDKEDGSPNFGANWFGEVEALSRLFVGRTDRMANSLLQAGVQKEILDKWWTSGEGALPLMFDGMPLQDAIDFAKFSVEVTIGVSRFSSGANTCGGDIDIAVIRPHELKWAQRKAWTIKD